MYVCMYVCMHACMHACMHVCMYVRTYVRTYVCMYVCTSYVCNVCMIARSNANQVARGIIPRANRKRKNFFEQNCTSWRWLFWFSCWCNPGPGDRKAHSSLAGWHEGSLQPWGRVAQRLTPAAGPGGTKAHSSGTKARFSLGKLGGTKAHSSL